jgi:chromosome segregation ATPase
LSTVPGSVARSGDSDKLHALQTKLTESEETVASLKTELESVNEKLSQLSVSAEEPLGDAGATEAIRAEHTAEIEKLASAHAEELQALQERLVEAESERKELEESSQKELEEARQSAAAQGDDKTVALLDELKSTHQTQLEAIQNELAEHKSAAAHFEEQIGALKKELEFQKLALEEEKALDLDHFNRELKGREQVMETLNMEIVKLNTLKEQEVRAAEESAQESVCSLQEQVASLEAKLAAAESATQESSEKSTSIAEKDQEITELKQALEKIQSELQEARDTAATELSSKVEELETAHEAAIASLKAEHEIAISDLSASHAEKLTVAMAAAESSGTEHTRQLQELRDALEAYKATAQKGQEDAVAELKTMHEAELKLLQEKLAASEDALGESRRALDEGNASAQDLAIQEIDALRHKCESLESQLSTGTGKINALLEEMQSKQAEAEAISRTLRDVEDHSKQESAQKDNKMKALEQKAAEAVFLLEKHTMEAAGVSEKHAQALEELKAEHAAHLASELERAKEASGSHDSALSDLQTKHDELLAANKELESIHATRVQSLEAELKTALESHAREIATHTEGREKESAELRTQFEETQAKLRAELSALQSSSKADAQLHEQQIAELQKGFEETKAQLQAEIVAAQSSRAAELDAEHSKAIAELQQGFEETKVKLQAEIEAIQASKAAEIDAEHGKAIEQLLTMHEAKLSGLREELETSNKTKIDDLQKAHDAALASVNEQLSQAKAAAQDTSALDDLKATVADLQAKLADSEKAHLVVQESATTASREIEDRYSAELTKIQADHAALGEKYEAAVAQVSELEKLAKDSDSQKSHLESIMKQLSESRDQLLKVKADNAAISDSLVDCKNQNKTLSEKLEAGERDLNDQIDKNMGLLNQLGDVDSAISASRRRVRELETELAVLKADSGEKSSSSGLEASRWATADEGSENAEDGGPATTEGEDLGPSIEGTVGDPRLKKSSYSSDLPAFHPFT